MTSEEKELNTHLIDATVRCGKCNRRPCKEPQLEKFQICSRCKQINYCSRDCQKSHWKDHKAICADLSTAQKAVKRAHELGVPVANDKMNNKEAKSLKAMTLIIFNLYKEEIIAEVNKYHLSTGTAKNKILVSMIIKDHLEVKVTEIVKFTEKCAELELKLETGVIDCLQKSNQEALISKFAGDKECFSFRFVYGIMSTIISITKSVREM